MSIEHMGMNMPRQKKLPPKEEEEDISKIKETRETSKSDILDKGIFETETKLEELRTEQNRLNELALAEGKKKYNYDACYWTPELKKQLADLHSELDHLSIVQQEAQNASFVDKLDRDPVYENEKRAKAKMDFTDFDDFVKKTEFEINESVQKFLESLKAQNINMGDKVTLYLHNENEKNKYRIESIDEYNGLLTVKPVGIDRLKAGSNVRYGIDIRDIKEIKK